MSVYTIKMSPQQIQALEERLAGSERRKAPPYASYQYRLTDCVITAYESGKVVFQGEGADLYAAPYLQQQKSAGSFPQAGSDEVGTGDYFGPVVVCAALVTAADLPLLQRLGVTDSKLLSDEAIRACAPKLSAALKYSVLILDNDTYNRVHEDNNMVAIKCKLHNQAYVHLQRKAHKLPDAVIIDQFVQEKSYYRYLRDQPQVIRGIHFETKAESRYPAVAAASVIARYAFLKACDRMSERYGFAFPKGAGPAVDRAIVRFVQEHGQEELIHVAKLHFANTAKALK